VIYDNFKNKMDVDITEYLKTNKNTAIKKILDALDLLDMDNKNKKNIRSVILDEINTFYNNTCRVLTFLQE